MSAMSGLKGGAMKNERIKREMAGMTQKELAGILGVQPPYVSQILKFELAKEEQDEIIRRIKERR